MLCVIAYDISDDRRRRQVDKLLCGFGERVQWSVFECYLSLHRQQQLLAAMRRLLDLEEDSVRLYPLCFWCNERVSVQGCGRHHEDRDLWVV